MLHLSSELAQHRLLSQLRLKEADATYRC